MNTTELVIVLETCYKCGVPFGMTQGYKDQKLKDGSDFYCINGHAQHYTESDKAKLERANQQLKIARQNTDWWKEQAQQTARYLSASRGQLTKIKKRISKGVCPCCNRQFVDLHRHMETQHPDYPKEEIKDEN